MRGAGDNHSSAQEGAGGSRHPGPLSILLEQSNRSIALFNKQVAQICFYCTLTSPMVW